MRPISVIIPSFRNPNYLDLCLKSLFENQTIENEVIVILDGFAEESESVVSKYPSLNVIALAENKGESHAHNLGVTLAQHDRILIVNADNVFPRTWDHRLDISLSEDERVVIAPNQIEPRPSMFSSFTIKDFGSTPETFQYYAFLDFEGKRERNCDPYQRDGGTWPIFMNKKYYMTVNGIDERYPFSCYADWDLFLRLELLGLELIRDMYVEFYHFANATATPEQLQRKQEREYASSEYFKWKWGCYPYMGPNNSHLPSHLRGIRTTS